MSAGSLAYSVAHFEINTDINALVSQDEPFRKSSREFSEAFPVLEDTFVAVIDADIPELATSSSEALAARLEQEGDLFRSVYRPGGSDFFRRNGLLYLSVEELEELADRLAEAQPLLALVVEDLSLRGLFSALRDVVEQDGDFEVPQERLSLLFDRLAEAFESVREGRPYHLSWQEIMAGEEASKDELRKFIILQPTLDPSGYIPMGKAVSAVRNAARELELDEAHGVSVRITGKMALNRENLLTVRRSAGKAAVASLFLVGLILFVGLGSGRLVFASLVTLLTGLVWTAGFAMAFVGHLNLISVTFAVLFIGLGIDSSIQFGLRYRELKESPLGTGHALVRTAQGVGKTLFICAVTTAIGFYSFVPTAYAGVSELGIIAGTGMFINFLVNLTVLPALLTVMPPVSTRALPLPAWRPLTTLPYKYPGAIAAGGAALGLGALLFLPSAHFDYNPLNVYDPSAESVSTAKELFEDPETTPWTSELLEGSIEDADEHARALRELEEVEKAVTISNFVPDDQEEKLDIIMDTALFMPAMPEKPVLKEQVDFHESLDALDAFGAGLELISPAGEDDMYFLSARRLRESIGRFTEGLGENELEDERLFAALEDELLANLPVLLGNLNTALRAESFGLSDLPGDLAARYVSSDGRYRVQAFPRENITDIGALGRFVKAVRAVAPGATGSPVVILGTGRTIVASFGQASVSALLAITIYLLMTIRRVGGTVMVLVPLVLAILLTGAASVIFDIPFNYANVIVVPLILGVGVDNGIHFIQRFRTEPPPDGNMLKTSTARAVLFSSLTTIMSFSSLSFSAHRGIASLGKLLTICMGFLILNTLVLLPSLLRLYEGRGGNISGMPRKTHGDIPRARERGE